MQYVLKTRDGHGVIVDYQSPTGAAFYPEVIRVIVEWCESKEGWDQLSDIIGHHTTFHEAIQYIPASAWAKAGITIGATVEICDPDNNDTYGPM